MIIQRHELRRWYKEIHLFFAGDKEIHHIHELYLDTVKVSYTIKNMGSYKFSTYWLNVLPVGERKGIKKEGMNSTHL
jgi:hypothetical protein